MATAVCHTPDCENEDVPVEVTTSFPDPDTGDEIFVSSVVCGGCGEPIEDVEPPLPGTDPEPPPGELDNSLPEGPPDRPDQALPQPEATPTTEGK
jgi:hypothetical protein